LGNSLQAGIRSGHKIVKWFSASRQYRDFRFDFVCAGVGQHCLNPTAIEIRHIAGPLWFPSRLTHSRLEA